MKGIKSYFRSLERLLFRAVLEQLSSFEENVMASQQQLANDLKALGAQVTKIHAEVSGLSTKVESLQTALDAAGGTTPDVDAAMAEVRTALQGVDDLVADAEASVPGEPTNP